MDSGCLLLREPSRQNVADHGVRARLLGSHDGPGMAEFSGLGVMIYCLVEAHPGVPEMGMCSNRHAAFHAFYAFSRLVDGDPCCGEMRRAFEPLDGPGRQRKQRRDRCRVRT